MTIRYNFYHSTQVYFDRKLSILPKCGFLTWSKFDYRKSIDCTEFRRSDLENEYSNAPRSSLENLNKTGHNHTIALSDGAMVDEATFQRNHIRQR